MFKTMYDASGLVVFTVASWGLKQAGDGVAILRRGLNGLARKPAKPRAAAKKRARSSNGRTRRPARRRPSVSPPHAAEVSPLDL
jgi:hypothetical protein